MTKDREEALRALEQRLGYRFSDLELHDNHLMTTWHNDAGPA